MNTDARIFKIGVSGYDVFLVSEDYPEVGFGYKDIVFNEDTITYTASIVVADPDYQVPPELLEDGVPDNIMKAFIYQNTDVAESVNLEPIDVEN